MSLKNYNKMLNIKSVSSQKRRAFSELRFTSKIANYSEKYHCHAFA